MSQKTYIPRLFGEVQFKVPFVAKTSDYTIKARDCGTVFTNRGASGAVAFTLPAVEAGLHYWFVGIANQNISIAAPTADTLVTFNDTAADSVAFSTANEKIGALAYAFCDGSNWIVVNLSPNTMTVTT